MSDSSRPPGFWRSLGFLVLAGTIVFCLAGGVSYVLVEQAVRTEETAAPDLLSLPLDEGLRKGSTAGFAMRVAAVEPTNLIGPGRILSQRPGPGDAAKVGAVIMVTISAGADEPHAVAAATKH